jgi:ATP-dependent RNA helicase SUPV3L1/SUV3
VRVDILERLADIIRPLIALDAKTHQGQLPAGAAEANGFRVTVEMTSLLGTAGEDFNSILTSLGYRVRRTPKVAAPAAVTPPVETEAQIDAVVATGATSDAADAATNVVATEAVEGTAAAPATPAAEAAEVETATADLGAPAPEPEAAPATTEAADAAPAEPQFDEVWFPGGRRPDGPRPHNTRRPHRADAANGEAPAEGARPPRRFNRDHAAPRPDGDKPAADGAPAKPRSPRFDHKRPKPFGEDRKPYEGKPKFGGKRDSSRDDWKEHRPREKREVALDPDSPWAALAALRNPKPE